jgi:valyl-tRNA synthetase
MNTEGLDDGDCEYTAADRWIGSRLNRTIKDVAEHFGSYRLDLAAQSMYEFTWHEFCDWYLELSKPVLQSDDSSDAEKRGTRKTLINILESLLRLMHPLIPFVTEEIWQQVGPRAGVAGDTIMLQHYPAVADFASDDDAERELQWVMQFILGIRQIRGEMDISPGKTLPVLLQNASESDVSLAGLHARLLERVGRVESISVLAEGDEAPSSATALLGDLQLLVPMKGVIDVDAERERLQKQMQKIQIEIQKANGKLGNDKFVNNAPAAVVSQERERLAEFERQLKQFDEQFAKLDTLE